MPDMKNLSYLILCCLVLITGSCFSQGKGNYTLLIHGGAGNIVKENMPEAVQKMYADSLQKALHIGDSILSMGGSSMDAVEACIRFLEDCPLFNAGKGAVYNADGKIELDASIMDGKTRLAGSVAGVKTIRHPISAARAVMEKSKHVMLIGEGAEKFAAEKGLEIVDPSYFYTERRWKDYLREKERSDSLERSGDKHGTVGCVALDIYGNLAAGTSTGGVSMKKFGRVGDSPVIGAGTYADNECCAVSATGIGEYFIRNVVAYDICALVKYKGMKAADAAQFVVNTKLKEQGGSGGVICLDAHGDIAFAFNTEGMFRGWVKREKGETRKGVAMFQP